MESVGTGVTFQNLLPFILAILLIFLIPMVMRRYGLEPGDIVKMLFSRPGKKDYAEAAKGKKREPWQTNGRSQDIKELVSTILIFARRAKLGLVYPGTVLHAGKMANLVAFIVTREEVIGINCFGFGGTITESGDRWNQHMNGENKEIPNPVKGNRDQYEIARGMMDENGMADVPLRVVAVFTSRMVTLETRHPQEVYDTKGLLEHLKQCEAEQQSMLDPEAVSKQLNEHVQRLKK